MRGSWKLLLPVALIALWHGLAVGASPAPVEQRSEVQPVNAGAGGDTARSDAGDREALVLTIYQHGQALVRDQRLVGLDQGRNQLVLLDVSPELRPETLQLRGEAALQVHAQRLERGMLSRQALLDAHIGRVVELRRGDGDGEDVVREGVLRSAVDGEAVVELEQGVELVDRTSPWRIRFPELPSGLRAERALLVDLETDQPGRQGLELLYLTGGLGWQADYVLELDDEHLDLMAWASLDNTAGLAFEQATVRLVAGEPTTRGDVPVARSLSAEHDGVPERPEGNYRLYTLPDPVDIGAAQRSQLPLFHLQQVPMDREYRLRGIAWGAMPGVQTPPVTVHVRFSTDENGASRAFPAGTARVYQRDADSEPLFLGEDRVPSTVPGGVVELSVGTAFDVTARRQQTDYRRLGERAEEQAWAISLRNTLDHPVTVRVNEQVPGDWSLLDSSHEPERKPAAQGLQWRLQVPAGETVDLSYRVEIRR